MCYYLLGLIMDYAMPMPFLGPDSAYQRKHNPGGCFLHPNI